MAASPERTTLAGTIVVVGVVIFIALLVGRAYWLACGGAIC